MSKERERKIPIQVYLSENEKYVLDEKIKASKMRNTSEYIRHQILYGYTYDIDYNGLKEYSYQIAALGRNINMSRKAFHGKSDYRKISTNALELQNPMRTSCA